MPRRSMEIRRVQSDQVHTPALHTVLGRRKLSRHRRLASLSQLKETFPFPSANSVIVGPNRLWAFMHELDHSGQVEKACCFRQRVTNAQHLGD